MNADATVFDEQQYVSLTTFRKSGAPVSTPVWVARDTDELVVITLDHSGKTKRLDRNPAVTLRPCGVRGAVDEEAPTYAGTARVVRDPADVAAVKKAIGRKYPLGRLGDATNRLAFGLLQRRPRAGIRITLT